MRKSVLAHGEEYYDECRRLHPGYTHQQTLEWVRHTLRTHPNHRIRKHYNLLKNPDLYLWLWRIAVIALLGVSCLHKSM